MGPQTPAPAAPQFRRRPVNQQTPPCPTPSTLPRASGEKVNAGQGPGVEVGVGVGGGGFARRSHSGCRAQSRFMPRPVARASGKALSAHRTHCGHAKQDPTGHALCAGPACLCCIATNVGGAQLRRALPQAHLASPASRAPPRETPTRKGGIEIHVYAARQPPREARWPLLRNHPRGDSTQASAALRKQAGRPFQSSLDPAFGSRSTLRKAGVAAGSAVCSSQTQAWDGGYCCALTLRNADADDGCSVVCAASSPSLGEATWPCPVARPMPCSRRAAASSCAPCACAQQGRGRRGRGRPGAAGGGLAPPLKRVSSLEDPARHRSYYAGSQRLCKHCR